MGERGGDGREGGDGTRMAEFRKARLWLMLPYCLRQRQRQRQSVSRSLLLEGNGLGARKGKGNWEGAAWHVTWWMERQ